MHPSCAPLADIGIPSPGLCLRVAGYCAVLWLFFFARRHFDSWLIRLTKHLERQRALDLFFQDKVERRAEALLRWIGYVVYAVLAVALVGIAWGAVAFAEMRDVRDDNAALDAVSRLPIFFVCAGLWLLFFLGSLLPRLRRNHEWQELLKFRAEQRAADEAHGESTDRSKPLSKPRITLLLSAPWRQDDPFSGPRH